uniref:HDC13130 n=1 Tax=Drosophila melanogaster TaxID=7227 RepID=Q6IK91_DROME|nr:TPA_inf: HDC13130 [Drosophila melanogaster]
MRLNASNGKIPPTPSPLLRPSTYPSYERSPRAFSSHCHWWHSIHGHATPSPSAIGSATECVWVPRWEAAIYILS